MFSGRPDGIDPGERVRIEALERQTSASVWSAIRYLDSPSDYREYLSCIERPASFEESELIFLDDLHKDCWGQLRSVGLTAGFACLALLMLMQTDWIS